MTQPSTTSPDIQSWSGVAKLALCNGLGVSCAVISVTASALATVSLGWSGALATVPYGIQFMAILLFTIPSSHAMGRFGRRPVFCVAAMIGIASGLIGYAAIETHNPYLICLAHALLGIKLANVSLYRFAALDVSNERNKATAMSLVLFGGTFAALLGPTLARSPIFTPSVFASAYIGIVVLSTIILLVVSTTPIPKPLIKQQSISASLIKTALRNKRFTVGVATCGLGYALMNLLMIASSLAMNERAIKYIDISFAVQFHVLAMFVPALFMGRIIQAAGPGKVMLCGAALLVLSSSTAILMPDTILGFQLSLILLGLSWNMMYLGGSFQVAKSCPPAQAISLQALSDTVVGCMSMIGAFTPGLLIVLFGWSGLNFIAVALVSVLTVVLVLDLVTSNRRSVA